MAEEDQFVPDTPELEVVNAFRKAKKAFKDGRSKSLEWRKRQLQQILVLIDENEDAISEALKKDLGVNQFFTHHMEMAIVRKEVKLFLKNIDEWTAPSSVATPLIQQPGSSRIVHEPLGVVLVISPWNYPFSLIFMPLIPAIAAGNCVVVKPSEISYHTSLLVAKLCAKYLDAECFQFVQGGVGPTTRLLAERFDFICYTGNGRVARVVHAAAAKHLTPVLFELGGKSPAIVTSKAEIVRTCQRIAWGKYTANMGQTCISPDYIATTADMVEPIVATLKETLRAFFGEDPKASPDVSRLISYRHCKRLIGLLDDVEAKVVIGGKHDLASKYMEPTVVLASKAAKCMQEEIFGPILPIVVFPSLDAIIEHVNLNDKPLALYVFSMDKNEQTQVLESTSSGGVCVNDVILHVANENFPFCGVGESGVGAYHGKFGFDTFSHHKPVYFKGGGRDPPLRFAPYTEKKLYWFGKLARIDDGQVYFYLKLALGAAVAAALGVYYASKL